MAAITSAGSGNWSATGTWVGGVVPTSADTVTIASGHTVTLDAVGCACLSVTTAGTGTLTCTTSANWDFTLGNTTGDTNNILISTGTLNLDMSAAQTYTGTVYLNKGNVAAGIGVQSSGTGSVTLKGAPRNRWTRLNGAITAGATSATVDDATGWRVGDKIMFGTTQAYNATPRIDEVVLTSVSGNNIGWTGGITYDHADNGYVGNFSSNLTVRPYSTNRSYVALDSAGTRTVQDVALNGLGGAAFAKYGLSLNSGAGGIINNNAFYSAHPSQANLVFLRFLGGVVRRQNNVFYASVGSVMGGQGTNLSVGNWERAIVFRSGGVGLATVNAGEEFIDSVAMACATGAFSVGAFGNKFSGCVGLSSNQGFYTVSGAGTYAEFENCDFGTEFDASNATLFNLTGAARAITKNCTFQSGGTFASGIPSSTKQRFVGADLTNKNNDATAQESYFPHCGIKRDNSNTNRSTSSISIAPTIVSTDSQRTLSIPCSNGQTVRVIGYVRRNNSALTATVSLTGKIAGVTLTPPTAFSSSAVDTWQQYDLSITKASGSDGSVTLTYTANSTNTTSAAYFDGVPDAPFVTKARHYGFLFNETSPTVTVDPYVVLSESAAGALTGGTINGGTKHITFGAGTIDAAYELYDYSRYWSVNNLTLDVPFSRAGSLFSLASGWTVVEPSISGITWGGGTIDWTSAGTKNGGFDSNVFDFQAAGTYEFGTATLSGTIELINTSGGAVIVNVPAGTSYTNTGPNITVNVAVDQAEALISGIVAGSRLQIYNVTTATEMVNAINATTSYSLGYPNGTGYSAGDVVRVRLTYCTGTTAKLPVEYVTIASAAGWSVLANQQDDDVYIGNGIDGSTVTEYASDYVNVQIDVSDPDGVTSIQRGYAWYCDHLTGDDGIRYFYGAFVAEDAFNYLLNTDVADIKIQNTGTTGVTLTGGAVRRKDGTSPIAAGGSVYIYYGRTYGLETGTSGLTPTEADKLLSIPDLATLQAAVIPVDVQKMNGSDVTGDGSIADPWRGVGVPV